MRAKEVSDNLADALVRDHCVNRDIYVSPEVFQLEMERIFEGSWVYVAHESEIPQPGDYKTTYMGLQPVIITRGADDGKIYGLMNSCRHRGATVCQHESGNANFFRCNYHGWTYANCGKLTGVPLRKGFNADFKAEEMGLLPVARIESHAGFIFASLNPDVPSLGEILGRTRELLDPFAADGKHPLEVSGVMKYQYRCNWKLAAENPVDGYHPDFSHQGWIEMEEKRRGVKIVINRNPESSVVAYPNGHSLLSFLGFGQQINPHQFGNLSLFPNVAFLGISLRVFRPISVDLTEVLFYSTRLKSNTDQQNVEMMRRFSELHGPAGHAIPDDVEMHERCQEGLKVKANQWIPFRRGLQNPLLDEGDGVFRDSDCSSEAPNRAFYQRWKELMSQPSGRRNPAQPK